MPVHLVVAASVWLARVTGIVVSFVTIRLLLSSLGTDHYAVYVLLNGLAGWFLLSDLGIGMSLQNFISEQRARQAPYRQYVAAAAILGLAILAGTAILLFALGPCLATGFLRRYGFLSTGQKELDFLVVGLLYVASTVGGIGYRVWYAEQRGYIPNLLAIASSLANLFAVVWVVTHPDRNPLLDSLLAVLLPGAALAMGVFLSQLRRLPWRAGLAHVRPVLARAFQFWGFALMAALVLQVDYLIIAQMLSPEDAVLYNLTTRIFGMTTLIHGSIIMAFWPVCTELITRQDWPKVLAYLRQYLLFSVGAVVLFTLAMLVAMPALMAFLSPREHIAVPVPMILLLGGYYVVRVWSDTLAMVLQSMSDFRPLWLYIPFQSALSIGVQYVLARHYGLYGIWVGLLVSFLATSVWVLPVAIARHVREARTA